MTLLRQLVLMIVTLFTVLFIGIVSINVHNTRNILNGELETVSQDAATSLGLSISTHLAKKETVIVESMANAVFDSGYYQRVLIADVGGNPVVNLYQPVMESMAPSWFIDFFPLRTPEGYALIMDGYIQAGSVTIVPNPGMAYAELWGSCVKYFFLFLVTFSISAALGVVALFYLLRPLKQVEEQANAISNREYLIQPKLPWTRELRRVVESMNLMTGKVRDMFAEQNATLERLRDDAYQDEITGLANRSYFEMQLRHFIASEEEFASGALIFVGAEQLEALNRLKGFQAGNAFLIGIANIMKMTLDKYAITSGFAARLSGPSFAMVVPDVDAQTVRAIVKYMTTQITELALSGLSLSGDVAHIGVSIYKDQNFGQLLSEADRALRTAQLQGPNAAHIQEVQTGDKKSERTATQWIELLKHVLNEGDFVLYSQPTYDFENMDAPIHSEIYLRIKSEEGEIIPAGVFMPMVHRLGMGVDLDKVVISELISRLKTQYVGALCMNLMPESLGDLEFLDWMYKKFSANPREATKIFLEFSDYAVSRNVASMQAWISRLSPLGVKFGVDRFGKGGAPVSYLNNLKIAYIKVDGSFIRGIEQSRENQAFVESLVNLAHGLDIHVIADSMENDEEMAMAKRLRINGAQGYGVAMPALWENA